MEALEIMSPLIWCGIAIGAAILFRYARKRFEPPVLNMGKNKMMSYSGLPHQIEPSLDYFIRSALLARGAKVDTDQPVEFSQSQNPPPENTIAAEEIILTEKPESVPHEAEIFPRVIQASTSNGRIDYHMVFSFFEDNNYHMLPKFFEFEIVRIMENRASDPAPVVNDNLLRFTRFYYIYCEGLIGKGLLNEKEIDAAYNTVTERYPEVRTVISEPKKTR